MVFRQKTDDEVVFAGGAGEGAVRNQTVDELALIKAADEKVVLDQILDDVVLARRADEVVEFAQTTGDGAAPVEIPDDGAVSVQTTDVVLGVDVRFTHGGLGTLLFNVAFEVELLSVVSVTVTVSVPVEWSISSTSRLEERSQQEFNNHTPIRDIDMASSLHRSRLRYHTRYKQTEQKVLHDCE